MRQYSRNKHLILMFLPGFLLFILFSYVPLYGILIAFKKYQILDGIWGSPWVGIDNFKRLFEGAGFTTALRNTLIFAGLKYLFVFPAPIIFALLLNEVRVKWFRRSLQTITYLPHFFSWIILAGILFTFLGTEGGFNQVLGFFGIPAADWLMDPHKFYGVIVATDVWQSVGWNSIIFFAALTAVDPTLYEAAVVDGAGRFRRAWSITLPSIMPTVITMLLLSIGRFLSVGFDQIYNLTTPTTSNVADILDTYVLRRMLTMDYELGAAAGIFSSVFGLILVIIANRLVKWNDPEQGLW